MLNHILVPLDGSPLAEQGLVYARKLLASGGKLTVVCAVDQPEISPYGYYPMVSASFGAMAVEDARQAYTPMDYLKMARAYLDQVLVPLREGGAFVVETVAEFDNPAELIVRVAKERMVEAICMSTHGRSGLSRWLFGSVTTKVLNATPCPVFVIPSRYIDELQIDSAESQVVEAGP